MKRILLTAMAVLAALPAGIPGASAGTTQSPGPAVRGHGWRLSSIHLQPAPVLRPSRGPVIDSRQWSGYAAVARPDVAFRRVVAYFNIPSINCANSLGSAGIADAYQWAGLGGINSRRIEAVGVDSFCNHSGTAQYLGFYQMYPLAPMPITGVGPGDAIRVSIYFDGSLYGMTFRDLTTGRSFVTNQSCSFSRCPNTSAEVVTSRVVTGPRVGSYEDLADFGMENITNATVTSHNGTRGDLAGYSRLWSCRRYAMVDKGGVVMAAPSSLYGGRAFNIAWGTST
jgi:hypothetical protein